MVLGYEPPDDASSVVDERVDVRVSDYGQVETVHRHGR